MAAKSATVRFTTCLYLSMADSQIVAFQTAVALAIYDSKMAREKGVSVEDSIPEIKEKHLSQIVSMSSAFKDYITSTHEGVKDADLAYRLGLRDDKFGKTTTDETRS